ncbi:MAG: DUF4286 family protein [Sphingobacteriales bacterium]|jgi:hypothetical protein|nr:DUF4286 family protein [Sphingobacteriales bacterium]OJV97850.1 MAG: hypothetical protein BGO52_10345 [Sphingobacteriales bacterium 44-61]
MGPEVKEAIVYNVTTKVAEPVADKWLQWMKEEHIPDIIGTGCFTHAVILRLIEVDETEGPTYAVQFFSESKALYNRYIENFSEEKRKTALAKWGSNVISFRSVLQVVN